MNQSLLKKKGFDLNTAIYVYTLALLYMSPSDWHD